MTRRPSRIVIAQAIVVGLLVVIVSITLLGPEENTPLSGIETPGELVPGPPGGGAGQRDATATAAAEIARAIATGEAIGTAPGARARRRAGPASESPVGVAPPATEDGGDAGSPADDQYADTLTRLTERLN